MFSFQGNPWRVWSPSPVARRTGTTITAPLNHPFVPVIEALPDCDRMPADINGDGKVDAFDIDPFVELLVGQ